MIDLKVYCISASLLHSGFFGMSRNASPKVWGERCVTSQKTAVKDISAGQTSFYIGKCFTEHIFVTPEIRKTNGQSKLKMGIW